MVTETNNNFIDGVALLAFRLDKNSNEPDVYSLITYGVQDIPLVVDNVLIFFGSLVLIDDAFELFDQSIKELSAKPTEVSLTLDISLMRDLIENQAVDIDATIINCLNILFDLINHIHIVIPKQYEKTLFDLADRLTFDSEFATFLSSKKISRQSVLEALSWCIGSVFLNSRLLKPNSSQTDFPQG